MWYSEQQHPHPLGACWKHRLSVPSTDLLHRYPHFNKISSSVSSTLMFEKHCCRDTIGSSPSWSHVEFLLCLPRAEPCDHGWTHDLPSKPLRSRLSRVCENASHSPGSPGDTQTFLPASPCEHITSCPADILPAWCQRLCSCSPLLPLVFLFFL